MNAHLESLARDKQVLVDRSALARLRLRRDTHLLRRSFEGKRASVAVPFLGAGRLARMLTLAGRIVLVARLARAAIGFARKAG